MRKIKNSRFSSETFKEITLQHREEKSEVMRYPSEAIERYRPTALSGKSARKHRGFAISIGGEKRNRHSVKEGKSARKHGGCLAWH